jgi:DNA-binding SARP family transcriptional activator/tetratricopeptide (TPR) repeat protein
MLLCLLGPLAIVDDSHAEIVLPHGRLRTLLAALLTRANQTVPVDELVDIVWDSQPTADAERTVRSYMARLRRALGPAVSARIHTGSPGYQCELDVHELDLSRFEQLCGQARAAAAEQAWPLATRLFAEALGLWRGTPLSDITSDLLQAREVPRLEQLRLQAVEDHIEAQVHLGRHQHLIPELQDLTTRFPLRERLHVQLMRSLAGAGRRAEALDAYHSARRTLVDQLGIEPGPELRRLQERILDGDTSLLAPRRPGAIRELDAVVAPRQLPSSIRHFVGREYELLLLNQLLTEQTDVGGGAVIAAIDGTVGTGKTALAVHWGHRHGDRFPDGQLYVDLRGADPFDVPVTPAAAVHGFLVALGVPARQIPLDVGEQLALYRSHLAARRMLVLLDDARDADQVRPLLPGSPGSVVLMTSRTRLTDLVALDGAVPITLDPLADSEAHDLLGHRLGTERVERQGPAVAGLTELCAGLPLALNIAAAKAIAEPDRPLAELVGELRAARRRVGRLRPDGDGDGRDTGDPDPLPDHGATDERNAALWAVRTFAPEVNRAFRMLAVQPGREGSVPAPAVPETPAPGAAGLGTVPAPVPGVAACLPCHCAAEHPGLPHCSLTRLAAPAPHTQPHLPPAVLNTAWSEAEYANLVAAWLAALAAADRLSDPVTWIRARRMIGHAYGELGQYDQALNYLSQALARIAEHPDPLEQAHTHRQLARTWDGRRDDRQALHHAACALRLYRRLNQPIWEAYALNQVGWYAAHLGHPDAARGHCSEALTLHRRHGNLDGEANTLDSLGFIEHLTGGHERAVEHYRSALNLYQVLGNVPQAATILGNLGHVYADSGDPSQARQAWTEAAAHYREVGRTRDAEQVELRLAAEPG